MAAINYALLQTVATQMIADFGQAAILRDDEDNEIPVTAIITDYGTRERVGDLILPYDRRALISIAAGVEVPNPETDKLVIDGDEYRIVNVTSLSPGGTALYFDCQVRR